MPPPRNTPLGQVRDWLDHIKLYLIAFGPHVSRRNQCGIDLKRTHHGRNADNFDHWRTI